MSDFQAEIHRLLAESVSAALAKAEAEWFAKHVVGNGTGEPRGLLNVKSTPVWSVPPNSWRSC